MNEIPWITTADGVVKSDVDGSAPVSTDTTDYKNIDMIGCQTVDDLMGVHKQRWN